MGWKMGNAASSAAVAHWNSESVKSSSSNGMAKWPTNFNNLEWSSISPVWWILPPDPIHPSIHPSIHPCIHASIHPWKQPAAWPGSFLHGIIRNWIQAESEIWCWFAICRKWGKISLNLISYWVRWVYMDSSVVDGARLPLCPPEVIWMAQREGSGSRVIIASLLIGDLMMMMIIIIIIDSAFPRFVSSAAATSAFSTSEPVISGSVFNCVTASSGQ